MSCEHCQSKHNAMLMARDNAETFKAERDALRKELSVVMKERRDALQRAWNAEAMVAQLTVANA